MVHGAKASRPHTLRLFHPLTSSNAALMITMEASPDSEDELSLVVVEPPPSLRVRKRKAPVDADETTEEEPQSRKKCVQLEARTKRIPAPNELPLIAMPPRASLPGLPQELQDAIVLHLPQALNNKTHLMFLSQTCKPLRATCLPHIYADISVIPKLFDRTNRARRKYQQDSTAHPLRTRQSRALFQTLISSPANPGKFVKRLRMWGLDARDGLAENALVHTPNVQDVTFGYFLPGGRVHSHHLSEGEDCKPSEPPNEGPGPSDGHNQSNDGDDDGRWLFPGINAHRLVNSLRFATLTLTKLEITYKILGRIPSSLRPAHTACELKHLSALQKLVVPWTVLFGWTAASAPELKDLLPPSLTHLAFGPEDLNRGSPVQWRGDQVISVVFAYVTGKEWEKTTPRLEVIHFDHVNHLCKSTLIMHHLDLERIVNFRKVLKDNGIKCISFGLRGNDPIE